MAAPTYKAIHGDCLVLMQEAIERGTLVDSIVCDPPYHLSTVKRFGKPGSAPPKSDGATGVYKRAAKGFMGQQWDGGDIAFDPATWKLAFDLLKPGGHLIAFGGARTYHRMACAIEDAGFEIRDQLMWLYGTGFPKSHDVSKGIDKAAGAEPIDTGVPSARHNSYSSGSGNTVGYQTGVPNITRPATDAAKQWEGWGTALKPSFEPLIWAQKPMDNNQNIAIIGSTLMNLWSRLWLILPVSAAEQNSTLSPAVCGVDPLAFAQWTADDASSTRDALCAQMGMSQFVSALISSLSTVSSWSATLAESWAHGSTSITETETKAITDSKTLKSCLLAITPENIIQAHSQGRWSSADASSATRYFSAAVLRLRAILELTAAEIVINADATFCPDETGKITPASNPIVLARKPLEGTVAQNVLKHGVGAINIDATRVPGEFKSGWSTSGSKESENTAMSGKNYARDPKPDSQTGRWPANVVLSWSEDEYILREDITTAQKDELYGWMRENT